MIQNQAEIIELLGAPEGVNPMNSLDKSVPGLLNARAPKALSELVCLGSLLVCFGISLTGSAAFAAGAATGSISMSWGTVGAEQNLGVRSIAVNRRGGTSGAASVRCTTVNGTALAGKDFTAISKVLTWASGAGADQDCSVTISDTTPFTGQKTFYIRLSDVTGAPLGTQSQSTVTTQTWARPNPPS